MPGTVLGSGTPKENETDKEAHFHGAHILANEDSRKEKANTLDSILETWVPRQKMKSELRVWTSSRRGGGEVWRQGGVRTVDTFNGVVGGGVLPGKVKCPRNVVNKGAMPFKTQHFQMHQISKSSLTLQQDSGKLLGSPTMCQGLCYWLSQQSYR